MNALMKSPTTLLLWILMAVLLSACGSDDDKTQAERAGIGAIAQAAGATPFVAQLSYTLDNFAHLDSVHYTIAGRPGSHSLPVAVTYDHAWLGRRAARDASGKRIAVPVFGLYANHRNELTLTTRFRDGSSHVAQVAVSTGPYTGPATVYATPEVRTARGAASPGVEFMLIKNGVTTPVILDSDGQVRWAGDAPGSSISSLFGDDAFYVGDPDAPLLHQVDVDGTVRSSRLDDPRFTNFHHDLARGKTGFLAELDALVGNVQLVESILAEIDISGRVLKEWDLGQIFRAAMRAGGDDPDNFVRDGADWFHMNSAIYDAHDNSLLRRQARLRDGRHPLAAGRYHQTLVCQLSVAARAGPARHRRQGADRPALAVGRAQPRTAAVQQRPGQRRTTARRAGGPEPQLQHAVAVCDRRNSAHGARGLDLGCRPRITIRHLFVGP